MASLRVMQNLQAAPYAPLSPCETAGITMSASLEMAKKPDSGPSIFGIELSCFVSLSALGIQDESRYTAALERRQVDFITALTNGANERCTFEIRLISEPAPTLPSRGRVRVFVLCRLDDRSPEAIAWYAEAFLRMLATRFPEYEPEPVPDGDLAAVLQPFQMAAVVEVARRLGREELNTLRPASPSNRQVGFVEQAGGDGSSGVHPSDGSIVHLFPFVRNGAPLNGLFRLLLAERNAIAIGIRLQPAELSPVEGAFLERLIAECERHGQVGLGAPMAESLSALYPTLRTKALAHQHHLSRLLFGLRDNAALMTIHVASAGPLSPFVPETLAGLITQPAGGSASTLSTGIMEYLAGGYEVLTPRDRGSVAAAFEDLSMVVPTHPLLPEGLERLRYLFDSVEATAAFRLPPISSEPLPGVDTRNWRRAVPPRNLPANGVLLGTSLEPGVGREVRIAPEDRSRHTYVVGQTGTGKSTMLQTMILDDIRSGQGVCVLDPHGDLYRELMGRIPEHRIDDVVLIDPTDLEFPVGMNLLEYTSNAERYFIVQEFAAIIARMTTDSFGDAGLGMLGPMFLQHVRMNLLLVMSDAEAPGTLLDFYRIFQDKEFWQRWLPLRMDDPLLQRWVDSVLPGINYTKQGGDGGSIGSYINSKFEGFVFDPMLRNIFAQKRSTVRIREAMDSGKIVLVNLAKGSLSESNSRFFGMIVIAQLQAAALGRTAIPEAERRPFYVYVDEFQSIATEGFVTLLSEARKFGLGLTLANQFVAQVRNTTIMSAVLGNAGTVVCFRLGDVDAERMEREMGPVLNRHDLLDIPNWHAYVSTMIQSQTVRPFELRTVKDPEPYSSSRADEVRDRSRRRYGRSRLDVLESMGAHLLAPMLMDELRKLVMPEVVESPAMGPTDI